MNLLFPKVPYRKLKLAKKRQLQNSRVVFSRLVKKADGCCINKECPNKGRLSRLEAHHWIKRSHGGSDHISNGGTTCPDCHYKCENGTKTMTALEFQIKLIEQHKDSPLFRWGGVLERLKKRLPE